MENYLGTILIWPVRYAPESYATCNGAQLTVQQNAALFALLGQTYGGSNQQNFNLPNLVNRVPFGSKTLGPSMNGGPVVPNFDNGAVGGTYLPTTTVNSVGLIAAANLPGHTHVATFAPVTGNVPVTVSAPAQSIPVTIPVANATPGTAGPTSLTGTVYLANALASGPSALRGPYQSAAPTGTPATLTGGTATGNPGGSFTGSVSTVTGGNITVQTSNPANATPLNMSGQTNQIPMPPYLAIGFIICTQGIFPSQQ